MKNLKISYEKGNWKYHFDSTTIDSSKELADIFAKIIMDADIHPQHVLTKLQEKFPNKNYKDN